MRCRWRFQTPAAAPRVDAGSSVPAPQPCRAAAFWDADPQLSRVFFTFRCSPSKTTRLWFCRPMCERTSGAASRVYVFPAALPALERMDALFESGWLSIASSPPSCRSSSRKAGGRCGAPGSQRPLNPSQQLPFLIILWPHQLPVPALLHEILQEL